MTLADFTLAIERLRERALFGGSTLSRVPDEDAVCVDGLDPMAESELLSALAFLDCAQRAAARADLYQARALAQSPYRR